MILQKLSNFILKIERVLIVITISIIFFALTLEVVFRYFLNSPLEWSGELAMYSLAWATFIGGSMSVKLKQASAVSVLTDKLSVELGKIIEKVVVVVLILFSLVLFVYSFKWIINPSNLSDVSRQLGIPIIIPYASVPVGFLFMFFHSVSLLVSSFIDE